MTDPVPRVLQASVGGVLPVTRRDQELLDKQFRWLGRSAAEGFLALSIFTNILLCVFIAITTVA
jgi:hypothetical protein